MVVELFIPKPPSSSFSSIAVASGLLDPMFASGELFEASDEPEVVKVPLTRSRGHGDSSGSSISIDCLNG